MAGRRVVVGGLAPGADGVGERRRQLRHPRCVRGIRAVWELYLVGKHNTEFLLRLSLLQVPKDRLGEAGR